VEQNPLVEIGLPIALFVILIGIGLTLTVRDFAREARSPRGVLVGSLAQLLVMPALGFLIAMLLSLPPAIAVGLVIIAACPGGTTSNLIAYLALTPTTEDPPEDRPARLFAIDELGTADGPRFAYDHDRIVPDALERARSKLEYTALATAFVAEPFTLGELRQVYETVWGVPLDAANFRRKVVSTRDFVVPIEGLAPPGPGGGRPAKRYRRGSAQRLHPAMLRPE
jgi:8-oxo-dGTP diphosphatase